MFKMAARRQAFGRRMSDEPTSRACEFAIIGWREGNDNQGRACIYRRVWLCKSQQHMDCEWSRLWGNLVMRPGTWRPIRVRDGEPHDYDVTEGVAAMVERWCRQRKGINRKAEPWLASAYAVREGRGSETISAEEVRA